MPATLLCQSTWASVASVTEVLASVVGVIVSVIALLIARSSLHQARQVAEESHRDWSQRKWFDLYFKADEAYDRLDHFNTRYNRVSLEAARRELDWNELMSVMRETHRMALVFPRNPLTDELFECTKFKTFNEAFSEERRTKLLEAANAIREQALLDASVLEVYKRGQLK